MSRAVLHAGYTVIKMSDLVKSTLEWIKLKEHKLIQNKKKYTF